MISADVNAKKNIKKSKIQWLYLTNFYKKYLQNLKYNVKRLCILHLILVVILYCPLRTGGRGGIVCLSMIKVICWQSLKLQHGLNTYSYTTYYSHNFTYSLSTSYPTYLSACNKGDKLKDHQQSTFEFFNRICVLISPLSLFPPSFKRQRFQNFVKFFDHIKCKNTKHVFAISNSSPFNFTP